MDAVNADLKAFTDKFY
jgi:pyruvate formate lyase activating enzyme